MTVRYFLDTNVLIYAATNLPADARKKARAVELISAEAFGVSAQVLAEFYVNVTRKGDPPMPPEEALSWVELLEQQECVAIDAGLVKTAIERSVRYQISYWDAAIIIAAEVIGATILYTEDLDHGQLYGSVRAVDPFRD